MRGVLERTVVIRPTARSVLTNKHFVVLFIFRTLLLVGLYVGVGATDAAWPFVVVAFAGGWAVLAAVYWRLRRNDSLALVSSRARGLYTLGEAFGFAGLTVLVLVGTDDPLWLIGWILLLVGVACGWTVNKIDLRHRVQAPR